MLENILVVHFTGGRFLSARIVPYLEITNLFPGTVDVGNDVLNVFAPVHTLLLVNIE
jgi:hypothetical protein